MTGSPLSARQRIKQMLSSEQPVFTPDKRVVEVFQGATVLVTGAAGSVGSEISRQVLRLPISRLLMLDRDENGVFELQSELAPETIPHKMLIGDVRDPQRVAHIFADHLPDIVLHAAAYKHVSMMESNCAVAVLNNVTGTRVLAEAAARSGCQRFLMISTDKAVNPVSVMGASKRVAEMVVQDVAERHQSKSTRFCCVRFGNVTASRGSVIPVFARQIAAGGPLTLTDDRMTRYFMSAAEAAHLVFEACSLAERGDIFVFDMGEPVRIRELAECMIEHAGLVPGKDIAIKLIGQKPGEKLHEELWQSPREVSPTPFSRVLRVKNQPLSESFDPELAKLEDTARGSEDSQTRERLMAMATHRREVYTAV